ncbi:MAG: DMT family protein [Polyangiales bacterium]
MSDAWKAAALLLASNTFMTFAWYGHLKFKNVPLWLAVVASWGIALFEYILMVPANRIGSRVLSGYQLKIMQEAITLCVFVVFALVVLGEKPHPKHIVSFAMILGAAWVAFR